MIAITSIAPGHKNFENQQRAVDSWKKAGYKVVSLNSKEEIELLKDFDVEFVETVRHNKKIFGKPYVLVSAIIDYIKQENIKYSLIINSDIIIKDDSGITEKLKKESENGVIIMNRIDFEGGLMDKGNMYEMGFDGFFINQKFIDIFPQSILCLGQCHWDYWLPYMASLSAPIIKLKDKYIYHQKHQVQYSKTDWIRTGEILRAEAGIFKFRDVSQVSAHVYRHIKSKFI